MKRIPQANPVDRWTVKSHARAGQPGTVEVTLIVENEVHGTLPVQVIHIDWADGPELVDVQARAVALTAQSVYCLAQTLMDHATDLMQAGQTDE
jgi:hypothetical protein